MKKTIAYKVPSVEEFVSLRNTTGWSKLSEESIARALANSVYSVCLYDDGKIIGMGRIVGDGSIYFYLQDVIVMPSYRGCGYGKLIVEELVKYVTSLKHDNSFVGLMSAIGTKEFYNKLGFTERPSERPGMSMIVNGNEEKYAHLSS